ncbi:MAG: hypothetical protein JRJ77_17345 [Deltaproteobacteria bacterium]|nr:hypothetical protein [Deltaproteobacteria bacterium]
MKTKKMSILVVLVVAGLSLIIIPTTANALDVASCTINRVGVAGGYPNPNLVQLIDQAASPAWPGYMTFFLDSSLGNEGLATLLTAYSMGKTVWVRIPAGAISGALITIIHINDTP